MTLINNKIKQFAKGNWGKPKGLQKVVKLRHLDLEPQQKPAKKKKRKQGKRKYIYKRYCCPFCHEELPLDEKRIAKETEKRRPHWLIRRMYRVTTCPKCKAYEVQECPACKRNTWYRAGWYKHQTLGCGFDGKKLRSVNENV